MNPFEASQPCERHSVEEQEAPRVAMSGKPLGWQFAGKSVRVLFLCPNNSIRSQMAEALLRHLSQGQVAVFSAGSSPAVQIHPEAVRAIARLGADIRRHIPKHLNQFRNLPFDRVIVLCDPEQERCPTFPGPTEAMLWTMRDPLQVGGTEQERLRAFDLLTLELNTRIRLLLTLLEREKRSNV